MHILFIDESGTPPKPNVAGARYFVVAGISIAEGAWHRINDGFQGLKIRRKIRGEIKWRFFSPSNDEARNPMRALTWEQGEEIRTELYKLITSESSTTCIASVCSVAAAYRMPSINTQEELYHGTYKPVTERFEYYLQDLSKTTGRKSFGIIVADHRGQDDDKRLRGHHQKLLHSTGVNISTYPHLIEGLFLEPSHISMGIQLADLVAGAVWQKFERGNAHWYDQVEPAFRRSSKGVVEGFGLVKFPKAGWV